MQTFQRSKPMTGGGVSVKMFGNVMKLLSMTKVVFAGLGLPFYQSTITEYDETLSS